MIKWFWKSVLFYLKSTREKIRFAILFFRIEFRKLSFEKIQSNLVNPTIKDGNNKIRFFYNPTWKHIDIVGLSRFVCIKSFKVEQFWDILRYWTYDITNKIKLYSGGEKWALLKYSKLMPMLYEHCRMNIVSSFRF